MYGAEHEHGASREEEDAVLAVKTSRGQESQGKDGRKERRNEWQTLFNPLGEAAGQHADKPRRSSWAHGDAASARHLQRTAQCSGIVVDIVG